jgi:hypothetical protein
MSILKAYDRTVAHRGRSSACLVRQWNAFRPRRSVSRRAGARLDQRHVSIGQPRARSGHVAPAGLTVLHRQFLDDINARTGRDALQYVPGVIAR